MKSPYPADNPHKAGAGSTPGEDASADPLTAELITAIFDVLHGALQAGEKVQDGQKLDALATSLQSLSVRCCKHALDLASMASARPACVQSSQVHAVRIEIDRAKTLAEAVDAVLTVVRSRALGELDQEELTKTWHRAWTSVTGAQQAIER
jgi:hypothetical protein